ncbi:uncharacterized protein METZ01_LOCUS90388 [marine metagenome]|uniref:Sulfatase-modifying factor enzyme domain-containing protein n=1 Tax=marine metagenome TaxID=408172 RepID=A0A381VBN9_9ZZZZ
MGLLMSLVKKVHLIISIVIIMASAPVVAKNKILVTGKVSDVDGMVLANAELSLTRQSKLATSNHFGEFDLGKIFTNDTVLVNIPGYQPSSALVASEIYFTLYPESEIREKIYNAREGEIVTITAGKHYLFPKFNSDSTLGLHIRNKRNLTIRGEPGAEIRLRWLSADLLRISGSQNIILENIIFGNHNPDSQPFSTNTIIIEESDNIIIKNCTIDGSGKVGISGIDSRSIHIDNCHVHDNRDFAFSFDKCNGVSIKESLIADNGEIMLNNETNVEMIENTLKVKGYFVPEFVFVEGGSIEILDESIIPPPPTQYLTSGNLYVGRTEVTFNQYDGFCEATGREKPDDSEWGRGDYPVFNITIEDAKAYCSWLSGLVQKNIRLPSSKEWEYAARGGKKGGDDKQFSGSNTIEYVAWCKYNSDKKPHEVGQKKPNELNIYDMSGNVYEFCSDRIDSLLVLKGGSWANGGVGCRLVDHVVSEVEFWDDNIGFRCFQDK